MPRISAQFALLIFHFGVYILMLPQNATSAANSIIRARRSLLGEGISK